LSPKRKTISYPSDRLTDGNSIVILRLAGCLLCHSIGQEVGAYHRERFRSLNRESGVCIPITAVAGTCLVGNELEVAHYGKEKPMRKESVKKE